MNKKTMLLVLPLVVAMCASVTGCGRSVDKAVDKLGKKIENRVKDKWGKSKAGVDDKIAQARNKLKGGSASPFAVNPYALNNVTGSDASINTALSLVAFNPRLSGDVVKAERKADFQAFAELYRDGEVSDERDTHHKDVVNDIRTMPGVPAQGDVALGSVLGALGIQPHAIQGQEVASLHTLHAAGARAFDLAGTTSAGAVFASLPAADDVTGFSYREGTRHHAYVQRDGQWFKTDLGDTPVDPAHVQALTASRGDGDGITFVLYR